MKSVKSTILNKPYYLSFLLFLLCDQNIWKQLFLSQQFPDLALIDTLPCRRIKSKSDQFSSTQ